MSNYININYFLFGVALFYCYVCMNSEKYSPMFIKHMAGKWGMSYKRWKMIILGAAIVFSLKGGISLG